MSLKQIMEIRILNAVVIALITFFSTLSVNYPPTISNVYASLIAFSLTFLVQIKSILNDIEKEYKKSLKKEKEKEDKSPILSNFLILL